MLNDAVLGVKHTERMEHLSTSASAHQNQRLCTLLPNPDEDEDITPQSLSRHDSAGLSSRALRSGYLQGRSTHQFVVSNCSHHLIHKGGE
uniref:Uncharacterized protein n=1 Tax=Kalanchoe fedtschenkoi TaxID=63787 RepID=A0A7N0UQZ6_KALFE